MNAFSIIPILISVMLLSACGGGGGGDDEDNSNPPQEPEDFTGTYNLSALSTTKFDINNNPCGNAFGTMSINDSEVSGSIIDTWGNTYIITGDVSTSGDVIGGFAVAGKNVATYEGHISGNIGNGRWEDIYQCEGDWEATKN